MKNMERKSMYAISFELAVSKLETHYPGNHYNNAYSDIKKFLDSNGFSRQQGSVYFGNDNVTAVTTVMTVNAMSREFPWLKACMTDIRMLRIEENNDLTPAL